MISKIQDINKFIIVMSILGILILVAGSYIKYSNLNDEYIEIQHRHFILKEVLKGEVERALEDDGAEQMASFQYDLAVKGYELDNYDTCALECEKSRKHSQTAMAQANQEISKLKVFASERAMYEEKLVYLTNLYEACEYLESACRSYDANMYEQGDRYIEELNVRIENHDKSVLKYNQFRSDFLTDILEYVE